MINYYCIQYNNIININSDIQNIINLIQSIDKNIENLYNTVINNNALYGNTTQTIINNFKYVNTFNNLYLSYINNNNNNNTSLLQNNKGFDNSSIDKTLEDYYTNKNIIYNYNIQIKKLDIKKYIKKDFLTFSQFVSNSIYLNLTPIYNIFSSNYIISSDLFKYLNDISVFFTQHIQYIYDNQDYLLIYNNNNIVDKYLSNSQNIDYINKKAFDIDINSQKINLLFPILPTDKFSKMLINNNLVPITIKNNIINTEYIFDKISKTDNYDTQLILDNSTTFNFIGIINVNNIINNVTLNNTIKYPSLITINPTNYINLNNLLIEYNPEYYIRLLYLYDYSIHNHYILKIKDLPNIKLTNTYYYAWIYPQQNINSIYQTRIINNINEIITNDNFTLVNNIITITLKFDYNIANNTVIRIANNKDCTIYQDGQCTLISNNAIQLTITDTRLLNLSSYYIYGYQINDINNIMDTMSIIVDSDGIVNFINNNTTNLVTPNIPTNSYYILNNVIYYYTGGSQIDISITYDSTKSYYLDPCKVNSIKLIDDSIIKNNCHIFIKNQNNDIWVNDANNIPYTIPDYPYKYYVNNYSLESFVTEIIEPTTILEYNYSFPKPTVNFGGNFVASNNILDVSILPTNSIYYIIIANNTTYLIFKSDINNNQYIFPNYISNYTIYYSLQYPTVISVGLYNLVLTKIDEQNYIIDFKNNIFLEINEIIIIQDTIFKVLGNNITTNKYDLELIYSSSLNKNTNIDGKYNFYWTLGNYTMQHNTILPDIPMNTILEFYTTKILLPCTTYYDGNNICFSVNNDTSPNYVKQATNYPFYKNIFCFTENTLNIKLFFVKSNNITYYYLLDNFTKIKLYDKIYYNNTIHEISYIKNKRIFLYPDITIFPINKKYIDVQLPYQPFEIKNITINSDYTLTPNINGNIIIINNPTDNTKLLTIPIKDNSIDKLYQTCMSVGNYTVRIMKTQYNAHFSNLYKVSSSYPIFSETSNLTELNITIDCIYNSGDSLTMINQLDLINNYSFYYMQPILYNGIFNYITNIVPVPNSSVYNLKLLYPNNLPSVMLGTNISVSLTSKVYNYYDYYLLYKFKYNYSLQWCNTFNPGDKVNIVKYTLINDNVVNIENINNVSINTSFVYNNVTFDYIIGSKLSSGVTIIVNNGPIEPVIITSSIDFYKNRLYNIGIEYTNYFNNIVHIKNIPTIIDTINPIDYIDAHKLTQIIYIPNTNTISPSLSVIINNIQTENIFNIPVITGADESPHYLSFSDIIIGDNDNTNKSTNTNSLMALYNGYPINILEYINILEDIKGFDLPIEYYNKNGNIINKQNIIKYKYYYNNYEFDYYRKLVIKNTNIVYGSYHLLLEITTENINYVHLVKITYPYNLLYCTGNIYNYNSTFYLDKLILIHINNKNEFTFGCNNIQVVNKLFTENTNKIELITEYAVTKYDLPGYDDKTNTYTQDFIIINPNNQNEIILLDLSKNSSIYLNPTDVISYNIKLSNVSNLSSSPQFCVYTISSNIYLTNLNTIYIKHTNYIKSIVQNNIWKNQFINHNDTLLMNTNIFNEYNIFNIQLYKTGNNDIQLSDKIIYNYYDYGDILDNHINLMVGYHVYNINTKIIRNLIIDNSIFNQIEINNTINNLNLDYNGYDIIPILCSNNIDNNIIFDNFKFYSTVEKLNNKLQTNININLNDIVNYVKPFITSWSLVNSYSRFTQVNQSIIGGKYALKYDSVDNNISQNNLYPNISILTNNEIASLTTFLSNIQLSNNYTKYKILKQIENDMFYNDNIINRWINNIDFFKNVQYYINSYLIIKNYNYAYYDDIKSTNIKFNGPNNNLPTNNIFFNGKEILFNNTSSPYISNEFTYNINDNVVYRSTTNFNDLQKQINNFINNNIQDIYFGVNINTLLAYLNNLGTDYINYMNKTSLDVYNYEPVKYLMSLIDSQYKFNNANILTTINDTSKFINNINILSYISFTNDMQIKYTGLYSLSNYTSNSLSSVNLYNDNPINVINKTLQNINILYDFKIVFNNNIIRSDCGYTLSYYNGNLIGNINPVTINTIYSNELIFKSYYNLKSTDLIRVNQIKQYNIAPKLLGRLYQIKLFLENIQGISEIYYSGTQLFIERIIDNYIFTVIIPPSINLSTTNKNLFELRYNVIIKSITRTNIQDKYILQFYEQYQNFVKFLITYNSPCILKNNNAGIRMYLDEDTNIFIKSINNIQQNNNYNIVLFIESSIENIAEPYGKLIISPYNYKYTNIYECILSEEFINQSYTNHDNNSIILNRFKLNGLSNIILADIYLYNNNILWLYFNIYQEQSTTLYESNDINIQYTTINSIFKSDIALITKPNIDNQNLIFINNQKEIENITLLIYTDNLGEQEIQQINSINNYSNIRNTIINTNNNNKSDIYINTVSGNYYISNYLCYINNINYIPIIYDKYNNIINDVNNNKILDNTNCTFFIYNDTILNQNTQITKFTDLETNLTINNLYLQYKSSTPQIFGDINLVNVNTLNGILTYKNKTKPILLTNNLVYVSPNTISDTLSYSSVAVYYGLTIILYDKLDSGIINNNIIIKIGENIISNTSNYNLKSVCYDNINNKLTIYYTLAATVTQPITIQSIIQINTKEYNIINSDSYIKYKYIINNLNDNSFNTYILSDSDNNEQIITLINKTFYLDKLLDKVIDSTEDMPIYDTILPILNGYNPITNNNFIDYLNTTNTDNTIIINNFTITQFNNKWLIKISNKISTFIIDNKSTYTISYTDIKIDINDNKSINQLFISNLVRNSDETISFISDMYINQLCPITITRYSYDLSKIYNNPYIIKYDGYLKNNTYKITKLINNTYSITPIPPNLNILNQNQNQKYFITESNGITNMIDNLIINNNSITFTSTNIINTRLQLTLISYTILNDKILQPEEYIKLLINYKNKQEYISNNNILVVPISNIDTTLCSQYMYYFNIPQSHLTDFIKKLFINNNLLNNNLQNIIPYLIIPLLNIKCNIISIDKYNSLIFSSPQLLDTNVYYSIIIYVLNNVQISNTIPFYYNNISLIFYQNSVNNFNISHQFNNNSVIVYASNNSITNYNNLSLYSNYTYYIISHPKYKIINTSNKKQINNSVKNNQQTITNIIETPILANPKNIFEYIRLYIDDQIIEELNEYTFSSDYYLYSSVAKQKQLDNLVNFTQAGSIKDNIENTTTIISSVPIKLPLPIMTQSQASTINMIENDTNIVINIAPYIKGVSNEQKSYRKITTNKIIQINKIIPRNRPESWELNIPLNFWFNYDAGQSIPLIALPNSKISIRYKLKDMTSIISNDLSTNNYKFSNIPTIKISLSSDTILLDTEERKLFGTFSHEYMINIYKTYTPKLITSIDSLTPYNLNGLIKDIILITNPINNKINAYQEIINNYDERYQRYIDTSKYYALFIKNGYYTDSNQYNFINDFDILEKIDNEIINSPDIRYNDLVLHFSTYKPRFLMYFIDKYCPNPPIVEKKSNGKLVNIQKETLFYYLKYLYNNSQTINEISPIDSMTFYVNGVELFAPRDSQYFTNVVPYNKFNTTLPTGYYAYTFSLFPLEKQPSGHLNFTHYDSVIFKITSNNNVLKQPYLITPIVREYNILRIISGIGSLAW
jgi:hypothetical protein